MMRHWHDAVARLAELRTCATRSLTCRAAVSAMVAALLPGLFCECSRPDTVDTFVSSRAAAKAGGAYVFTLDMSDTLATYDLTLYTRLDCSARKFAALGDAFPVEALWTSPDGTLYGESFEIPKDACCASTSFSKSYRIPYRSGLRPVLPGEWTLSLKVGDECARHLNGMGVIFDLTFAGAEEPYFD